MHWFRREIHKTDNVHAMTYDDLKAAFALVDDWEERYALLIDLAKKMPPLPEAQKTPENIVKGCMSQVWMVASVDDGGRLQLAADSDALLVRGLIALLLLICRDKTAEEVARMDISAELEALDLSRHVSVNRRNGLASMVLKIRALAAEAIS